MLNIFARECEPTLYDIGNLQIAGITFGTLVWMTHFTLLLEMSGAAPPALADEATPLQGDPPVAMVQETMALGINNSVLTGTDEAVPVLARTLTLGVDQRQAHEAARLEEEPSEASVAPQEILPDTDNRARNISRTCRLFSFRPPRSLISPYRVDLDEILDVFAIERLFYRSDEKTWFGWLCAKSASKYRLQVIVKAEHTPSHDSRYAAQRH
ncbi:hypothetical protein H2200_002306 [Cladophialophora chaetospira]|uniref:Uncharacterized protein n=1 Tax=Cladophialophora chaetospira TaxID=386627 RepID=A0AA38XIM1_9EURO|nr:hypothetical protein H2200_002306 [Cladophialophora chaetospira]